jgi:hypothetical protein
MPTPTGSLFNDPRAKPLSTTGQFQAGCYYCFFVTGGTTPANVYADGLLATPLSQPTPGSVNPSAGTVSDSAGRFVAIYLNPAVIYRAQLYSAAGSLLEDTDPYVPAGGTAATATSATQLNGIPAINYARQSRTAAEILAGTVVQNTFTGVTNAYPYTAITDGATVTINCQVADSQSVTIAGNRTMAAPTNPADGQQIDLLVIQDATGGRTLTWNAAFLFENNAAPVLSTVPGGIDRFLIKYSALLGKHVVGHFASIGAGGTTTGVNISGNATNFNLFAAAGQPSGVVTVNVTVAPGVILTSADNLSAALDVSGFASGSIINLTNLGYIIGKGGDGANGGWASYPGSGTSIASSNLAGAGGPAINGPGTGVTLNITNAAGHIWGGGGGGGGGGAYDGFASGNGCGNAGGGGGGAGGGKGGIGGLGVYISGGNALGGNGVNGTIGVSGAGGAAGTGTAAGTAIIGVAGAGGAYGTAGSTGVAPSTATAGHTAVFSAGGAAGKAINLNSGTGVFVSGGTAPNVIGAVS